MTTSEVMLPESLTRYAEALLAGSDLPLAEAIRITTGERDPRDSTDLIAHGILDGYLAAARYQPGATA